VKSLGKRSLVERKRKLEQKFPKTVVENRPCESRG